MNLMITIPLGIYIRLDFLRRFIYQCIMLFFFLSYRRKKGATSIQEMESKRRMDRASRAKKTLRKLVDILKSSDRTDKQSQIIRMIRGNPSLVNVLMKLREV